MQPLDPVLRLCLIGVFRAVFVTEVSYFGMYLRPRQDLPLRDGNFAHTFQVGRYIPLSSPASSLLYFIVSLLSRIQPLNPEYRKFCSYQLPRLEGCIFHTANTCFKATSQVFSIAIGVKLKAGYMHDLSKFWVLSYDLCACRLYRQRCPPGDYEIPR